MVEDAEVPNTPTELQEPVLWRHFLESHAPGRFQLVSEMTTPIPHSSTCEILTPEIRYFCPSDACNREQFFEHLGGRPEIVRTQMTFTFLHYQCKNCEQSIKTFAIMCVLTSKGHCSAFKLGEVPTFGPQLPSRLVTLIGPDRELFLLGRRAESQGLGIGAFAYYRRVVENQWRRLAQKIIDAAERLEAPPAAIETLKKAAKERQFDKAVGMMGDAIPDSLKIKGHNPLKMLHSTTSAHLHELTDAACLEIAGDVRGVLTALAERITDALRDQAELDSSVSRLLQKSWETKPEPIDHDGG